MNSVSLDDAARMDATDPLAHFRDRFQLRHGLIYLDGNSLGVMPKQTLARMQTALSEWQALSDRQRMQLMEVATPVIRLWDGIVAVPLIGTLDSARSQIVMETLLNAVVEQHARFAILDITGVPTVDSLVAQHLMKTVAAARLMGAECIVSGIRPAIAQTIVHLGLDLDVITRASLADALGYALHQLGADIVNSGAGQR